MPTDTKQVNSVPSIDEKKIFSMWVDKYKPSSVKQIIGQQGEKSNAKKLLNWIISWRKNRQQNKKPFYGGGDSFLYPIYTKMFIILKYPDTFISHSCSFVIFEYFSYFYYMYIYIQSALVKTSSKKPSHL